MQRVTTGGCEISFYLLHRSDDVDVYIVDQDGRSCGRSAAVYMRVDTLVRHQFTWNGRRPTGRSRPTGTYYIRVSLIHQGRSVLISNSTGRRAGDRRDRAAPQPG